MSKDCISEVVSEVFAQDLAENRLAQEAVQSALGGHADLCGVWGLMYLCQQIVDFDGPGQWWDHTYNSSDGFTSQH